MNKINLNLYNYIIIQFINNKMLIYRSIKFQWNISDSDNMIIYIYIYNKTKNFIKQKYNLNK